MTQYITGIKNEKPFYFFERISEIPRASGNEAEIAEYICRFADERGLKYLKDENNNVLVIKNATQGRENEATFLLQAHTDMVCEKNKATHHDFSKDPIRLIRCGNILRADGTTLGADDGFGVALMLAVLDSKELSTPKIECLFTSSEEIGLVGASKFDYSNITARKMINLDSAEESTVIIGCCGGVRTRLTYPVDVEKGDFNAYKISVGGLFGGHSGEDIDKGRSNANVLMGKLLEFISGKANIRLSYIDGGDRDNAIPRECEATVICDTPLEGLWDEASSLLKGLITAREDEALYTKLEKTHTSTAFSLNNTKDIIKILSVPNGVLHYRTTSPFLPRVSRNLARVRTEQEYVEIGFSSRSYLDKELEDSMSELDALASDVKGEAYHHERYPGWESPRSTPLVKEWVSAYRKVNGTEPEITLIHAGLECGIITGSIDGMEAISVGCNLHDLHTPGEAMEIDSMDKMYDVLTSMLEANSL